MDDRGMKVESLEAFRNGAGTKLTIMLKDRDFLSDESIPPTALAEDLRIALFNWLDWSDSA